MLSKRYNKPKKNKPKAYLQGFIEFYKLKFIVTPDVLIPRPETELLVDEVLQLKEPKVVLDIGTGSGCIAVSIAKNSPQTKIIATDISQKALAVAKLNAKFHRVEKQVTFIQSDLLKDLSQTLKSAKSNLIIVTNLPYIPTKRIPALDKSVTDYEPYIALNGGEDGFEMYRILFKQIKEKGVNFDLFVGEIDDTHRSIALQEAKKNFPGLKITVKKDLYNMPRILRISLKD